MSNLTRAMTKSIERKYPLNESQEILKKSGDLVLEKSEEFDGTCYSVYKNWKTDSDGFGYGTHLNTFTTLEKAKDYFEKVKSENKKEVKESLSENKDCDYVDAGTVDSTKCSASEELDEQKLTEGAMVDIEQYLEPDHYISEQLEECLENSATLVQNEFLEEEFDTERSLKR